MVWLGNCPFEGTKTPKSTTGNKKTFFSHVISHLSDCSSNYGREWGFFDESECKHGVHDCVNISFFYLCWSTRLFGS